MEDYIFKYLDKRHTIEGNTVYFKDSVPSKHIADLFGVNVSWDFVDNWIQSRIGKEYCIIYPSGTKAWYMNGELHREDGPAIIRADGEKFWYKNGMFHRDDGPAIIWADGEEQWYLNGCYYTEKGFNIKLEKLNG